LIAKNAVTADHARTFVFFQAEGCAGTAVAAWVTLSVAFAYVFAISD
jgi:hypothetical protein